MAASNTDLFRKGTNNFSTTLSGSIAAGDTTITLASTTNLPTDTGIDLVIDRVDASGNKTPNAREYIIGVVSGSNIISILRGKGGSSAASHNSGAVVEYVYTQDNHNDQVTAFTTGHTQLGAHIASLPLTTPKITTSLFDTNALTWIAQVATASAVNWLSLANAATGTDPIIAAAGSGTNLNVNIQGKGTGKLTLGKAAISPFAYDYVASGCVWSGDAYASTRNGSMTAGVVVVNGNPVNAALVTAHVFTASKDTYIDAADNGDGTALLTYTEATNNAASPALSANNVRIAIIVTGASNIANAGSVNQGQETMILPIASSVAYTTTDSLGNLICPRDPARKILGYRQTTTNTSTADGTGTISLPGLTVPVIIPAGRKVNLIMHDPYMYNSTSTSGGGINVFDSTSSATTGADAGANSARANGEFNVRAENIYTPPASGARTFQGRYKILASGTINTNAGAGQPVWLKVELV